MTDASEAIPDPSGVRRSLYLDVRPVLRWTGPGDFPPEGIAREPYFVAEAWTLRHLLATIHGTRHSDNARRTVEALNVLRFLLIPDCRATGGAPDPEDVRVLGFSAPARELLQRETGGSLFVPSTTADVLAVAILRPQ